MANHYLKKLVLTALLILIFSYAISAAPENIYFTYDSEDYLQMTTLIGENYLLFLSGAKPAALSEFQKQVDPEHTLHVVEITKETIAQLSQKEFSAANTGIVVKSDKLELKIIGTLIAQELNCPIFFSEDELIGYAKISKIVSLGDSVATYQELNLPTLEKAYDCYEQIRQPSNVQIYTDLTSYGIMAVHLAQLKDGFVIINNDFKKTEGGAFIWVTGKADLSFTSEVELIQERLDFDQDGIYDYPFGIYTGITPADLSLQIERTRYVSMSSSKDHYLLELLADVENKQETIQNDMCTFSCLNGTFATYENLQKSLPDASYFEFLAHGSGSGFQLNDQSFSSTDIPLLPPMIVTAESCCTANIPKTKSSSIALGFIRQGGLAYIGSIKTGGVGILGGAPRYFFSNPNVNLGQMVRLQNYALKKWANLDTRAVLFGDPTISLFNENFKQISLQEGKIKYKIPENVSAILPDFTFGVFLPENKKISYAEISNPQGKKERLDNLFNGKLISLPYNQGQVILLNTKIAEGTISFYEKIPIYRYLAPVLKYMKLSLQVILIDILLNSYWWLFFVIVLIFSFLVMKKDQLASWKTPLLFIIFTLLYLGYLNWHNFRFSYGAFVIYFFLTFIPLNMSGKLWSKIGKYLLLITIPTLPAFFVLLKNPGALIMLLVGLITSASFPLIMYGVVNLVEKILQQHSSNSKTI